MTVSGKLQAVISIKDARASDWDRADMGIDAPSTWGWTLADGIGSGQADRIWGDRITGITTSVTTISIEALAGSVYGIINMSGKLKAIAVKADDANTAELLLSQPATTGVPFMLAASDAIRIPPGAMFLLYAPLQGFIVGANNDIGLAAVSGTLAADVFLVGTSA